VVVVKVRVGDLGGIECGVDFDFDDEMLVFSGPK
jgi:hypothetical protein